MCVVNFQCFIFILLLLKLIFCLLFQWMCAFLFCIAICAINCIFTSPLSLLNLSNDHLQLQHCKCTCENAHIFISFNLQLANNAIDVKTMYVYYYWVSLAPSHSFFRTNWSDNLPLKLLQFILKDKQRNWIQQYNRMVFNLLPFELSSVKLRESSVFEQHLLLLFFLLLLLPFIICVLFVFVLWRDHHSLLLHLIEDMIVDGVCKSLQRDAKKRRKEEEKKYFIEERYYYIIIMMSVYVYLVSRIIIR